MGQNKTKSYPMRIDDALMHKVKTIASTEDRPISKQLERIIRAYIDQYEQEHGEIPVDSD